MSDRGWAVVTGATRGIGWSIAERLASDGYAIWATGRDTDRLGMLSSALSDRGVAVRASAVDLAVSSEVDDFAREILEVVGNVTCLVNNAGFAEVYAFSETPYRVWRDTFQVNLNAALDLTVQLHGNMPVGSSIINVGSILGTMPTKSVTPYVITKGALHHATKVLALELAPRGIRVNAVAPGFIATDMFAEGHSEENKIRIAKAHPIGRVGAPEEVAAAVSFLCSDAASFITGAVLPVDGGLAATMVMPDLGVQWD
jgi:NAD(P)-dependent dehydrogenase (short-subunit alcohol dehydrogenase family)